MGGIFQRHQFSELKLNAGVLGYRLKGCPDLWYMGHTKPANRHMIDVMAPHDRQRFPSFPPGKSFVPLVLVHSSCL
jgi:hypothetical protein